MRGEQDIREAIMQNLKDAGCTKKQAEEFFKLYDLGEKEKIVELLKNHKECLLKKLRSNKKEIDDLDYLILDIKNNYDGGK